MQKYWPVLVILGVSLLVAGFSPAYAEEPQKEVKYETGFYYTVKKGDTLWDISQRFNDTPWQWPDLWKENDQLPNPHWIYPGERIRLYRKSDQHQYQAQTKQVPSAAPQVAVSQPVPGPPPQVEFFYNRMDQVGFIRKPAVQPLGRIFSVIDNKKLISPGDIVYLSPSPKGPSTDFAPGARFTVYRAKSPTPEKKSIKTIGTQHLLLGVVEVTQKEPDYAIAKVIDSFRAINVGDLLMEYRERTPDLIVTDSTPGMEGTLISSEEHTKLIGSNFTAFIDKGKRDNIHEGQQYSIIYQETKKGVNGKTIKLAPVDLGSFIVLHTEETTSTVYVTQAFGKIAPGQPFKTP